LVRGDKSIQTEEHKDLFGKVQEINEDGMKDIHGTVLAKLEKIS